MASLLRWRLLNSLWQRVYRTYGMRGRVTFGRNLHIGIGSIVQSHLGLQIGENVYIGKYCTISCGGTIGDNVLIANNVGLVGRYDHDFRAVGTTIRYSPWIGDVTYTGPGVDSLITIEDDVWIGYGAVVLSGVRIARGSVIGAGSVVTSDVDEYAIVAGNPARPVGVRFTPDEVRRHESLLAGH